MRVLNTLRAQRHAAANAADAIREERLDGIRVLVERFTYGLALLLAGRDTDLEQYTESALALRLRTAVDPFLQSGHILQPDFGPHGELRVVGDLLAPGERIEAFLEFDDRSFRESDEGELIPSPRRRINVHLWINIERHCVLDCRIDSPP
jgi:hypothetical protein